MTTEHPVRRLRRLRGIRFGQLAAEVGISESTLASIERGATRHPSSDTIDGLARALTVTPRSLRQAIDLWVAERPKQEIPLPRPDRYRTFVDWREATGLSQSEFAVAIGVSHGTVSTYERGLRHRLSEAITLGLTRTYGVPLVFIDQLAALPPCEHYGKE